MDLQKLSLLAFELTFLKEVVDPPEKEIEHVLNCPECMKAIKKCYRALQYKEE